MRNILSTIKTIASSDRKILVAMIFLFVSATIFAVLAIINIQSSSVQVPFRQTGNLGEGYYYTHWYYFFTFPFLGIVFGVLHNLIAVKLYSKKGAQITAIFLGVTFLLLVITIIVVARLLGLPGVR